MKNKSKILMIVVCIIATLNTVFADVILPPGRYLVEDDMVYHMLSTIFALAVLLTFVVAVITTILTIINLIRKKLNEKSIRKLIILWILFVISFVLNILF